MKRQSPAGMTPEDPRYKQRFVHAPPLAIFSEQESIALWKRLRTQLDHVVPSPQVFSSLVRGPRPARRLREPFRATTTHN